MVKEGSPNSMQRLNGGPPPFSVGKPIEGGHGNPMYTPSKFLQKTDDCWPRYPIAITALRPPLYLNQDLTRTLPNELLREIFCFLCFGSFDRANLTMPYGKKFVETGRLLICQISSRWRTIALSTPSLWASIYVPDKPKLSLLKLWLERSGRFPLSLSMHVQEHWCYPKAERYRYSQYFNDAMSLLLTEKRRWKHIFFMISESTSGIEGLASADIASISILESASLIFMTTGEDTNMQVFDAVSNLPRLREFAWKTFKDPLSSFVSPAWSRLTDIALGTPISTDTCIQLLGLCQSASRVVIKKIALKYGDDFEWRTNQIVLPFLQSLYLADSKGDMTVVLDHFTMPSLRHLRISTGIKEGGVGRLERFFSRSACPLECFAMFAWLMSKESMLRHLQISAMSNVPSFIFQPLLEHPDGDDMWESKVTRGEPCPHSYLPALSYM